MESLPGGGPSDTQEPSDFLPVVPNATPESPLEKALYPAVENVIERDYPNPNRDGCLGRAFLEKAAFFPGSLNAEENALVVQHVPKCWPCFKELKHLRETAQALKRPPE